MSATYNDIRNSRIQVKETKQSLKSELSALAVFENQIKQAQRSGTPIDPNLLNSFNNAKSNVESIGINLASQRDGLKNNIHTFINAELMYINNPENIQYTDSRFPIALMPLRIETRFIDWPVGHHGALTPHIWLRIYPDEIWIESLCKEITLAECEAANIYLKSNRTKIDWESLCKKIPPTRAAFVVKETYEKGLTPQSTSYTFAANPNEQPSADLLPETFRVHIYSRQIGSNLDYTFSEYVDIIPVGPRLDVNTGLDPDFATINNLSAITRDAQGNIQFNDASLKWIYDFAEAENMGLARKIYLNQNVYPTDTEFRLIVIGVKESMDIEDSTQALKDLFNNHRFTEGLTFLKHGQPTKNADAGYATFNIDEDIIRQAEFKNATKDNFSDPLYEVQGVEKLKTDGQLLAEAFGFESSFFDRIYNSQLKDINTHSKFNDTLWQTTGSGIIRGRDCFKNIRLRLKSREYIAKYISARGKLPSFRIGNTPYGVIPSGNTDGIPLPDPKSNSYEDKDVAYPIKRELARIEPMYWGVAREMRKAGGGSGDEEFAEIIGKHAVPQEIYQRVGFGAATVWNNYMLSQSIDEATQWLADKKAEALNYMDELGMSGKIPEFLQTSYLEAHQLVTTPLVTEYCNDNPLPNLEAFDKNYIQWLAEASFADLLNAETIFEIEPDTVLYKLVKNSLLKEYWSVAADLLNVGEENEVRTIAEIWDIFPGEGEEQANPQMSFLDGDYSDFKTEIGENPRAIFEKNFSAPSGNEYVIKDFFDSEEGAQHEGVMAIASIRQDLGEIASVSSRDLDLLTKELIALYTYRYDAWQLSVVNLLLADIRNNPATRNNSYIGAYGWVTDLKPNSKGAQNTNLGFVFGATQEHAGAGALIKSAHAANSSPSNPTDAHHISLTSEKARKALQYLEGVNNGQVLSVLLGYDIEKLTNDANLNKFILPMRNAFPHNFVESVPPGVAVETIAPRNVVNGNNLLETFRNPINASNYNFFFSKIANVTYTDFEKLELIKVLQKVNGVADGLADLTESEAAYQMIVGNLERAGAFAEAVSGSKNTPSPQVIDTPNGGISITNKITYHLNSAAVASKWEDDPSSIITAKAALEPSIDEMLKNNLPSPENIKFIIEVFNGEDNSVVVSNTFTARLLQLSPYDFISLFDDDYNSANSALKQRMRYCLSLDHKLPENAVFTFNFDFVTSQNDYNINQVYFLCKTLRQWLRKSRPLVSSDYFSPELPVESNNEVETFDKGVLVTRVNNLQTQLNKSASEQDKIIKCLQNALTTNYNTNAIGSIRNYGAGGAAFNANFNTPRPLWSTIEGNINGTPVQRIALNFGPANNYLVGANIFSEAQVNDSNFTFSFDAIISCNVSSGNQHSTIFSNSFESNDSRYVIIGVNNNGDVFCEINNKRFTYNNSNVSLRDGKPHHIFISKTPTTIDFVIDNVYSGYFQIDSSEGTNNYPPNVSALYATYIGYTSLYSTNIGFDGKISSVRIWNTAIDFNSEKESLGYPNFNNKALATSLICDWKMDDIVEISLFKDHQKLILTASEYNLSGLLNTPFDAVGHKSFFHARELTNQAIESLDARFKKLLPINTSLSETDLLSNAQHNLNLILGEDAKILPRFSFRNKTLNGINFNEASLINVQLQLHIQNQFFKQTATTPKHIYQEKIDLWLQGVSRVSSNTNRLKFIDDMAYATTSQPGLNMHAIQLPNLTNAQTNDLWAAYDFADTATEAELKQMYGAARLCIAAHIPEALLSQSTQCGLLVDEWDEIIPEKTIEGGIAFHYDKPFAKPPQAIILALPPYVNNNANWQRNMLRELVHETFELSIKRSVDYEQLAQTKLAPLTLQFSLPFTAGGTFQS